MMKILSIAILVVAFLVIPDTTIADTYDCQTESCQKKIKQLTKFAKNGSRHAMAILGVFYFHGEDVEQNYKEAAKWFGRAARKDSNQAKYYLSLMYRQGLHFEQDIEKADELLSAAADANFVLALVDKGVEAYTNQSDDLSIALEYFKRAEKFDSPKAAYLLAKMTELGHGTAVNEAKAMAYYKKAANHNYRDSIAHYKRLSTTLTPEQVSSVSELAQIRQENSDIERIEVMGQKFTMETHLDFIIGDIKKQRVYNGARTGRIQGKACDKWSNPPCNSFVNDKHRNN